MAAAAAMMSENNPSACSSPRISFSHDIQNDQEEATIMHDPLRTSDSTRLDKSLLPEEEDDDRPAALAPEFMFCFDVTAGTNSDPRTGGLDRVSPADELFMNGVLLPIHYRHQIIRNKNFDPRDRNHADSNSEQIRETSTERPEEEGECEEAEERRLLQEEKEEEIMTTRATLIRESSAAKSSGQNYYSKSFWRFNRSTSLNSSYHHEASSYNKKRSSPFWSLHLLSRSNSTGSSPAPTPPTKHNKGPHPGNASPNHHHKQAVFMNSGSANSLSSSSSNGMHRKPPLMKQQSYHHYGSGCGPGGGSNCPPLLNVPPPYIAKGTSDLLGLASFFRINGGVKDKKNKKR